ncbi:MAG: response regulator transcription factor [Pseudohongiellaceae bacterium]
MSAGSLLLVEDDPVFARVLARALSQREYQVEHAENLGAAEKLIGTQKFDFAILDLNLAGQTSLSLIPALKQQNPGSRILILTGYASIATAVEAIKLGADNYLAKPADTDEVLSALLQKEKHPVASETAPQAMSVRRLEWEHIQKVLLENDGNISETARQLNMHRRTLQRKLHKRPVSR